MKELQKCCAHCPGRQVTSSDDQSHDCCLPNYVTGNLKVQSLRKHVPECPFFKRHESPSLLRENQVSCQDKFTMAKKLHAENLQHQPLPDKVDDEVFKNYRNIEIDAWGTKQTKQDSGDRKDHRLVPALGCKKPSTRMDLAICWETPVDPDYEPRKPVHIDGSNGGVAPAIFALVQHTPTSTRIVCESSQEPTRNGEKLRHSNKCEDVVERKESPKQPEYDQDDAKSKKNSVQDGQRCCCECLCETLDSVDISKTREIGNKFVRRCPACEQGFKKSKESRPYDPRFIRSSIGLGVGENSQIRRNGLPAKVNVPRQRTPFAKRSFCIDSLAPPFSVVNGCRGADYPEHWRLMTVYQQSYKNPQKHKVRLHR